MEEKEILFRYSTTNPDNLINGPIELQIPDIKELDHGEVEVFNYNIANSLDNIGMKTGMSYAPIIACADNMGKALEAFNIVNDLLAEASLQIGTDDEIPPYKANLDQLARRFGRYGDVWLIYSLGNDGLVTSLRVNVAGADKGDVTVYHRSHVNSDILDSGLNTDGIDERGYLILDLLRNPQAINLLKEIFSGIELNDKEDGAHRAYAAGIVSALCLAEIHLDKEAKALGGGLSSPKSLGTAVEVVEGKQVGITSNYLLL